MVEQWLLLKSGVADPALNMAIDETLLESVAELGRPVLRFYGWNQPAATFGYFQRFREVEMMTELRPLIRRPTGGGLVPHQADWTYSLSVPPEHSWYCLTAVESYRAVHNWIRQAFDCLQVSARLAPETRKSAPGQCFLGAERFDLIWKGTKVAGAAQRRNRLGLLIQGSIQPGEQGWPRAEWELAMTRLTPLGQPITWSAFAWEGARAARALALATDKYSQPEYNRRR